MHVVIGAPADDFNIIATILHEKFPSVLASVLVRGPMLDQVIRDMAPGDVFIAELGHMIPDDLLDEPAEAIAYIAGLDALLPAGTHGYLIDLGTLHNDPQVLAAVEQTAGHIYLQAGPMTVHELPDQLERWQKEDDHAAQPSS